MTNDLVILIYLLGVNIVTVLLFRFDKSMSEVNGRRIPEKTLLTLAFMGGSPGAFWARRMFRHKTQKQPFSTYLILIVLVQILMAVSFVSDPDSLKPLSEMF